MSLFHLARVAPDRLAALTLIAAFSQSALAMDITFLDVTDAAGLSYTGDSFGQAFGDFDVDGNVDLFISNHGATPSLFHNQGDGTFIDIAGSIVGEFDGDTHGGSWADFDNDGDRDIFYAVGAASGDGARPNRFLVNDNGTFVESAVALGVDFPLGRGRTPLWFDWNDDGQLDLLVSNWVRSDGQAPTALFTQSGGTFSDDTATVALATTRSDNFATLFLPRGASRPILLIASSFPFPDRVLDFETLPFSDVSAAVGVPDVNLVQDAVAADLDGDLYQEIYLSTVLNPSEAVIVGSDEIRASLNGSSNSEIGISFRATGPVTFETGPFFRVTPDEIRIGASGYSPADLVFTLDPTDTNVHGTPAHDPAEPTVFVYYDPAEDLWHFDIAGNLRPKALIQAAVVSDLTHINFVSSSGLRADSLLDDTGSGFVDVAASAGVNDPNACESIALADFDNDMDIDIFRACRSIAINLPNQLLENDGSGNFTAVALAAGAEGTTAGRSDTVTVADYDNDGFLDLFISNGRGEAPLTDGPSQLFRNQGNDNHWLALQLQGTVSNSDGIGTFVIAEAGGVRQSRLQANGVKRFGQDHQRLHFGLGPNLTVDRITLHWPSGMVQVLDSVAADQILTVTEPPAGSDSDADGIADDVDNCTLAANASQLDADGDGFGNACDTDVNNDCVTNVADLGALKLGFFSTDTLLDFNADGIVNSIDLGIMKTNFFAAPGPSAAVLLCSP